MKKNKYFYIKLDPDIASSKDAQKKLLEMMMRDDERSGIYEDFDEKDS